MNTQVKELGRSVKLGLDKLYRRDAIDDAADRIVAAGFWLAPAAASGRVLAFPVPPAEPVQFRVLVDAAPLGSTSPNAAAPTILPTVI